MVIAKVLKQLGNSPTVENMNKLQRNDRAMIRWICNVKLKHRIDLGMRVRKLECAGHVQKRMLDQGCIL